MNKALHSAENTQKRELAGLDWRKRMSDHVAYALLVYTGLHIFVTMSVIKGGGSGSLLPYFTLVVLVAAIIPGCRAFERRWSLLNDEAAQDPSRARAFFKDCLALWICAIALPVALTAVFKGMAAFL